MAHAVVKDGPYFSGTGPIKFSDLRSQWLGVNSGSVKASTFFRNLNREVTTPVVGDSTENADIASDPFNAQSFESNLTGGFAFSGTGRDWKISQMRDSIKSYTINQTDSATYDKNVDGDNLEWNSNLDKTIPKYYNIQGNIHAVTDLQPPTIEPDNALKFVSNMITNLNIEVSGSVLGSGGKGGYYLDKFNSGNTPGEPGGHAIKLNSDDGKGIAVSITNTGKIYGGGGGGGKGGKGSQGPTGVYYASRVTGGSLSGGIGEWYSYQVGLNCQCEYYSSCGDETNITWHWSVDEFNYSISNGGSNYQVGDIVEINDARKDTGVDGNAVRATAEVTSVNASVGAYISDGTDGNNAGDIVATGNGTKQIKIRMGWDDSGREGVAIGQYKVDSLGIDFMEGLKSFSRQSFDADDAGWLYDKGRFVVWQNGDDATVGYDTYPSLLYESLPDDSGDSRYVGWGPEGIQVPTYSRNTYQDSNGNPNEKAPWTQIVTVTGGNVYPCTLIKPQNVTDREGVVSSLFYSFSDNNETVALNNWFFFTNKQQRMYFKDNDNEDGNCAIWLSEIDETIDFGYKAVNDPNANNNTNTGFDSALPVAGENFVDGIKILTGGKRYYHSLHDQTIQTTSGGSGSGLTIFITTAKGWLRDGSGTKHETRPGNGGSTLTLGSGNYSSNKAGGGCSCFFWCRKTCIGPAYCIIEDPTLGIGAEGGAGGFGGQGRGSNGTGNDLMTRTDGVDGGTNPANPPTTTTDGGIGGTGGAGGDWAIAGGDGQDGQCNNVCVNPEDGNDGGVAGRAIFGTNYTVNDGNFNSTRVKGAYQPS